MTPATPEDMLVNTYRFLSALALVLAIASSYCSPTAYAQGNDLTIKTGGGEELSIKNGLFGGKQKVVKDRFGDKYESKKGLFGTRQSKVSVLGNNVETKKGLLGGTEVQATSVFGDKVTSKKGWFGLGRRQTTVELGGVSSMIGHLFKRKISPASPAAAPVAPFGTPANWNQDPVNSNLQSSQAAQAEPHVPSADSSVIENVQGWSQ